MTRPLRVSEAAAALGVHPNTIRNWVGTGRLSDIRTVGARTMRLDPDEVEALVGERVPLVAGGVATFRLTVPMGVERIIVEIQRVPEVTS